ncbi:hypothetical protein, partial [Pseudidiomarina planktonica]|uniref:hypothetical protein n=1 Tax=Pseudidiomarina planktonica TaxID=1323738 RepID=UPI001F20D7FE
GGFVPCLKRGAHFRDLTRPVKRLFHVLRCFFTAWLVFHPHGYFPYSDVKKANKKPAEAGFV